MNEGDEDEPDEQEIDDYINNLESKEEWMLLFVYHLCWFY